MVESGGTIRSPFPTHCGKNQAQTKETKKRHGPSKRKHRPRVTFLLWTRAGTEAEKGALQALGGPPPMEVTARGHQEQRQWMAECLTFFTLACSTFESFSAFLASFSSCFAVN